MTPDFPFHVCVWIFVTDIVQLLQHNPEKRLPLDQIPYHPWITKYTNPKVTDLRKSTIEYNPSATLRATENKRE